MFLKFKTECVLSLFKWKIIRGPCCTQVQRLTSILHTRYMYIVGEYCFIVDVSIVRCFFLIRLCSFKYFHFSHSKKSWTYRNYILERRSRMSLFLVIVSTACLLWFMQERGGLRYFKRWNIENKILNLWVAPSWLSFPYVRKKLWVYNNIVLGTKVVIIKGLSISTDFLLITADGAHTANFHAPIHGWVSFLSCRDQKNNTGTTHCNFWRYHFQPFSLNLVLPSVVKPSGEIAERGKRHLTWPNLYHKQASCRKPSSGIVPCASLRYRSARLSPSLTPLTSRRPWAGAEK